MTSVGYAIDKKQQRENELQVLIDVSGSMKQNDPENLRIPAVKLLINLLPEGTKAGIWLFSEDTRELVKTGVVDQQWKKNALLKVKNIHSRGLLTNIEEAIKKATQEWLKPSGQQNRHLILLTDGMVDVSKDIMQSAESRARVMSDQIPLLQQAGVKVQAIALSDEADAELLGKLAFDTQGWAETALSADQLQKVFFKLFKQAVPQNTVPITGNVFSVDNSVKEFSVLIFKKDGAAATQLISPDKVNLNYKIRNKEVSWLNEKNYDLVTIKQPKAGEWRIVASMDPENQVMIVTDLKFEVDELPNYISLNEQIEVTGFFTDKQQLITRKDFLSLIDISAQLEGGTKWNILPAKNKEGFFRQSIGEGLKTGRHVLKILADGKTFKREFAHNIEVTESLIEVQKDVNLKDRTVTITVIPDKSIINVDMMAVEANISQVAKQSKSHEMQRMDDQWQMLIQAPKRGDSIIVNFSIMANTVQGRAISPNIPSLVIDDRLFDSNKPKQPVIEARKNDKRTVKKVISDKPEQEPQEQVDEVEAVNWTKTSIIVVIINVLLILSGFFGFKYMKKQTAEKQEKLLSRLD